MKPEGPEVERPVFGDVLALEAAEIDLKVVLLAVPPDRRPDQVGKRGEALESVIVLGSTSNPSSTVWVNGSTLPSGAARRHG
jgi:hypothetical protein